MAQLPVGTKANIIQEMPRLIVELTVPLAAGQNAIIELSDWNGRINPPVGIYHLQYNIPMIFNVNGHKGYIENQGNVTIEYYSSL